MCTSFKSIFNHRTTAVVFGGRCRAQVRNLKLWVSLIILGNIMGVQEHSWYKRLGVKPQCHPLTRTLMHHIELHRHECLIIFFPFAGVFVLPTIVCKFEIRPNSAKLYFHLKYHLLLKGPSTKDIRFLGHFLTYLPTHIRFSPIGMTVLA